MARASPITKVIPAYTYMYVYTRVCVRVAARSYLANSKLYFPRLHPFKANPTEKLILWFLISFSITSPRHEPAPPPSIRSSPLLLQCKLLYAVRIRKLLHFRFLISFKDRKIYIARSFIVSTILWLSIRFNKKKHTFYGIEILLLPSKLLYSRFRKLLHFWFLKLS